MEQAKGFLNLPEYIINLVYEFLSFSDIIFRVSKVCRKLYGCSRHPQHLIRLQIYLNQQVPSLEKGNLQNVIKLLKILENQPKMLKFVGFYTNGGIYASSWNFWVGNLFEYSGTCYTAEIGSNVHVIGIFAGKYMTKNTFWMRHHEDICRENS